MRAIPNFTVMAPKDEAELQQMLVSCLNHHDGPTALRIPPRIRREGMPLMEEGWESIPMGRGELLREGDDLMIVAYGAMVASGPGHGNASGGSGAVDNGDQCPFPAPTGSGL